MLFTIHLAATLAMTGLIWFVQIVHYPLFHQSDRTPDFFKSHADRTGFIVIPLMLVEITTAAALLSPRLDFPFPIAITNIALLLIIWLVTAIFSVPCHQKLIRTGYDPAVVDRLIHTNWLRTLLWTARSLLLLSVSTL
ncbi:MAG: hypothetical protein AAF591_16310 [Verrucomicrobiota bacterium]